MLLWRSDISGTKSRRAFYKGAPKYVGENSSIEIQTRERNMAGQDKSFADLVAEAPAAPTEGVVSLVGVLARSSEAGKFVLTLPGGRAVTLETADVKGHAVLGASVGRTIVRIEIEAAKVQALGPQPLVKDPTSETGTLDKDPTFDTVNKDPDETVPYIAETGLLDMKDPVETDVFDTPWDTKDPLETTPAGYESNPLADTGLTDLTGPPDVKLPFQDRSYPIWHIDTTFHQDNVFHPAPSFGSSAQPGGVAPFALATQHQAPSNVVAALQSRGARPFAPRAVRPPMPITGVLDVNTGWADYNTGSADTGTLDY
jgi:hypothetical protein